MMNGIERKFHTRIWIKAMRAITFILLLATSGEVMAVDYASIVRKLSRMPDDIPVARIDDVIANKRTSEAGAALLKRKVKDGRSLAELPSIRKRALQEAVEGLDPSIIRLLDALPSDAQDAVYLVSSGARIMRETIPDIALRADFLRDGGADVLAMLGRRGDLAGDALEFRNYLKAGKLPSLPGERPITLGDLARFMDSNPKQADNFWKTYVKGKEIHWLGTAGLAAVLLAPDDYLDETGNIIQQGVDKLGRIVGSGIEGIVRGGTEVFIKNPIKGFFAGIFSSLWSISLLLAILGVVFWYFAPWRFFIGRLATKAYSTQHSEASNKN